METKAINNKDKQFRLQKAINDALTYELIKINKNGGIYDAIQKGECMDVLRIVNAHIDVLQKAGYDITLYTDNDGLFNAFKIDNATYVVPPADLTMKGEALCLNESQPTDS